MKYVLPALFLIASVAADVSHLSNTYLPPEGDHHHHHQQAEYAEQTNEVPQVIGANTYTPEHLLEPSNSLVPEASQPEAQQYEAFPPLQDADIRIDQSSSNIEAAFQQPEAEQEQQPAEAVEATHQQSISSLFDAAEEQQPAAQQFVPQTYGNLVYSNVPEQGPAGVVDQHVDQQYDAAASSSSIDTQYGANGGYVY